MRRFIFRLPRFAGKRRVGQYLLGGGRYPCEAILDIGATVVKDRALLWGSGAIRFQMAAGRDLHPPHGLAGETLSSNRFKSSSPVGWQWELRGAVARRDRGRT